MGHKACCYLLHILLEDTELQPLVEPHLAVLPDALQSPLVVQHLVHHIQHLVHGLGVVGCGCERLGVPRTQGTLQHIQQSFAILADLREGREFRSRAPIQGRAEAGRIGKRQEASSPGSLTRPDTLRPQEVHQNQGVGQLPQPSSCSPEKGGASGVMGERSCWSTGQLSPL